MQLTCPTCGARYRIDATLWPTEAGPDGEPVHRARRARCKVCRTVWNATPEEELLELEDPLPPEDEPRPGEAAWASLGGWPEPKPLAPPPGDFTPPLTQPPPVFTPPKDPGAPIYAPPARPPIHFESPPVPISAQADTRPPFHGRLPGPAAFAEEDPEENAPAPAHDEQLWEDDDEYESTPRRLWLWSLVALTVVATVAVVALLTGRLRPEDYGLPPVELPQIGLPAIEMPRIEMPRIEMPRAPESPLAIEADAVKRRLPDARAIWEVSGRITNPTKSRQPVPTVELLLLDSGGRTVGSWTVRPETHELAPGGTARFETGTVAPPDSAVRVRVQLKPAELGRL